MFAPTLMAYQRRPASVVHGGDMLEGSRLAAWRLAGGQVLLLGQRERDERVRDRQPAAD